MNMQLKSNGKKNIVLLFIILFLTPFIYTSGQIPPNYYLTASGKAGFQLQNELSLIIDNHRSVSYTQLWSSFLQTDTPDSLFICDIYMDNPASFGNSSFVWNQDQCESVGAGIGVCYNREHIFCQSWFGGGDGPIYTDLFHIYPIDGYVNSIRNNNPFGEVQNPVYAFENGAKFGPNCVEGAPTGSAFEPIDAYKGDVARSLFYIATRYMHEDGAFSSSEMTNHAVLEPWAVRMLLQWHYADPVSQKEIDRNSAIFMIQHNRNPFIDHPEFVAKIWDNDSVNVCHIDADPIAERPSVTSCSLVNEAMLKVVFSHPVIPETVENLSNYQLGGLASIQSVNYSSDTLTIGLGGLFTQNAIYYLRIQNILGENLMFMNDTLIPFVYVYPSEREVIAAFTFDNLQGKPNTPLQIQSDFDDGLNTAILYGNGDFSSSVFTTEVSGNEWDALTGTTFGDPRMLNAVAGQALSVVNASANRKSLVMHFSSLERHHLFLSMAVRRTGTGFNNHTWEWSDDGFVYHAINDANTVPTEIGQFEVVSVNLSGISELNNRDAFYLRLQFDGASGSTGNNRLDNIVLYSISPLSIEDYSEGANTDAILVFPNPATNHLNIMLDSRKVFSNENMKNKRVQVFTMQGQLIDESLWIEEKHDIDVNSWSRGIYYVKVTNQKNDILSIQKIVLQ